MIRPLELFIGLRYTRAKRRNHFISFISLMATLGIVLGVAALITVLSVMNGFGKELRSRILGVVSHVTVTEGVTGLSDWQAAAKEARKNKHVVAAAPYITGQGMLLRGRAVSGVMVRGVLPELEQQVSALPRKLTEGDVTDLKPGAFRILLGVELARQLGVRTGARVALVVQQDTSQNLSPRMRRFTVAGVFRVGMYQYDNALALMHLEDAAVLYRLGTEVSGLRLKLDDGYLAPMVGEQLVARLGGHFRARDWTQEQRNFFVALEDQKRILFIVLALIIAVAAFNIVSTLVMLVTDKQGDIAILRTLGLSPRRIMGVFMVQGTLIGLIGTLLGVIGGIVLASNVEVMVHFIERVFDMTFLAADVYLITDLPADIHWSDVSLIIGASLAMGFLATLYPAWRAARIQPAEVLRYE